MTTGIEYKVLIVEHDPYARAFVTMLLARDWRTKVVANVNDEREVNIALKRNSDIDLILLDTEIFSDPEQFCRMKNSTGRNRFTGAILCMGTEPDSTTLKKIVELDWRGYIIKREIQYGLAEAISCAVRHQMVITPSVKEIANDHMIVLPDKSVIINSHFDFALDAQLLTPREKEIVELFILFNLSQHDLADELNISLDYIRGCVHSAYQKIGLNEYLGNRDLLDELVDELQVSERFRLKFEEAQNAILNGKRASNMPTLAYHLLTLTEKQFLKKRFVTIK